MALSIILSCSLDTDLVHFSDEQALIWAAVAGRTMCTRVLLDAGADINAVNDTNHTALMEAVVGGHEAVCELLGERGADTTVVNEDGEDVWAIAKKTRMFRSIAALQRGQRTGYQRRAIAFAACVHSVDRDPASSAAASASAALPIPQPAGSRKRTRADRAHEAQPQPAAAARAVEPAAPSAPKGQPSQPLRSSLRLANARGRPRRIEDSEDVKIQLITTPLAESFVKNPLFEPHLIRMIIGMIRPACAYDSSDQALVDASVQRTARDRAFAHDEADVKVVVISDSDAADAAAAAVAAADDDDDEDDEEAGNDHDGDGVAAMEVDSASAATGDDVVDVTDDQPDEEL